MKETFKFIVEKIIVWEAKLVLKKYKPRIIAITGSVGKTSTKDAIFSTLVAILPGGAQAVRKSDKSFNSDIGVALTVLGLPNGWYNPFRWLANFVEGCMQAFFTLHYPKLLVLEIGADRPGDIARVTEWVKPDIVVLTKLADVPVHVEFFPSVEALVSEKGQLVAALKPTGTLILNADDERVTALANGVACKKITYGFGATAAVRVGYDEIAYAPSERSDVAMPAGLRFRLEYGGTSIPVMIAGVLGRQHIYPLAAAFAVATALGETNHLLVAEALAKYEPTPGRMRLVTGMHETVILDDSYNASPVAVAAGLEVLESLKVPGRKIAVLGDMMELGDYSVVEHRKVGERVAKISKKSSKKFPTFFVGVGVRMRGAADAALDAGMDDNTVLQFDTSREAGRYLADQLQQGDAIFVKGSQSLRMERVTEELMEHREIAEKLLARQEGVWKRKK